MHDDLTPLSPFPYTMHAHNPTHRKTTNMFAARRVFARSSALRPAMAVATRPGVQVRSKEEEEEGREMEEAHLHAPSFVCAFGPHPRPFSLSLHYQAPTQVVRRTMAGHGSAPPATGWEGEVRKVLKEDWQVVCGIMGFYTTLYLISKLFTGGAKAVPEAGTCGGTDFGGGLGGCLPLCVCLPDGPLITSFCFLDGSPLSCPFLFVREDALFATLLPWRS